MMMVVVVLEYNRIRDGMKVKERRKVDASPQRNACARSSVSPNHQLTQPVLTVLIPELSDGRDVKVAVGNSADNKTPAAPVQVRTSSKGFSFLCCGLGNKGEGEENGPATAKGDDPAAGNNKDFEFEGFSKEACHSLISMMDVDRSGSLAFEEFRTLWETLRFWKKVFQKFDVDKSGTMSTFELRDALKCIGYHINNATLTSVVLRFTNRDRILRFDDYIILCARLRNAFEVMRTGKSYGGVELLNILLYL
ncbi:unnamed protein product [Hymenolepis diminuta]|uniref:EF-hand domain-containing protein n=1 Tax=Hymenolepis diminuta TaxID=6216 RepID=A0A564YKU4_HYMDI|nr:unnamed protein product [Hymenolepis diminuta]